MKSREMRIIMYTIRSLRSPCIPCTYIINARGTEHIVSSESRVVRETVEIQYGDLKNESSLEYYNNILCFMRTGTYILYNMSYTISYTSIDTG